MMSTRRRLNYAFYILDISPINVDEIRSGNDDAKTASLVEELCIGLVNGIPCAMNWKSYQHELQRE